MCDDRPATDVARWRLGHALGAGAAPTARRARAGARAPWAYGTGAARQRCELRETGLQYTSCGARCVAPPLPRTGRTGRSLGETDKAITRFRYFFAE